MICKVILSANHLICSKRIFSHKTAAGFYNYRVFVSINQVLDL